MTRAFSASVLAALGACAWWEGGRAQSSVAAHWSVLAAIALVVVTAVVAGAGRQAVTAGAWARGPLSLGRQRAHSAPQTAGVFVWIVLVCAALGWNLFSFVEQRHDLPTLSRLIGDVTAHWAGRSVLFALWLVLGIALALGWRRER